MTAVECCLPIIVIGQGVKRLGKLNVPLGALAVRQSFKNGILQQREPFRVSVMLGDLEVLLVHIGHFFRRCIREDVMQVATNRAAFKLGGIIVTIRAFQQHIHFEMGDGLLKQLCALFGVHDAASLWCWRGREAVCCGFDRSNRRDGQRFFFGLMPRYLLRTRLHFAITFLSSLVLTL
jgi:hypothetical protein